MVRLCFGMWGSRGSLPAGSIIYFFVFLNHLFVPIGAVSSNPTGGAQKNSPLSTAFNSRPTYPRKSLWGSWIPLGGWGVAESGGNRVKIENKLLLFSKKFQNFDLFKNPSFKVDNILRAYYHHVWWYVEPIRLLPEFHSGIQRNKCSVITLLTSNDKNCWRFPTKSLSMF